MTDTKNTAGTGNGSGEHYDAVIVGAGFGGMYMLHRFLKQGLTARVFERGDGVGGTWYWNRYPGARCDVDSLEYSYQFDDGLQQEWQWTERFSSQPEILKYANHVADRFGLRPHLEFNTPVKSADYSDAEKRWTVRTETGKTVTAKYVVMATGCLSSTNVPQFKGGNTFKGATYHTGQWPHEGVDFTGLRVGIIGTGSSAVQSIPLIAKEAKHLTVFQRTPNYVMPAQNKPMDPKLESEIKADYKKLRNDAWTMPFGFMMDVGDVSALDVTEEERLAVFEKQWNLGGLGFLAVFNDLLTNDAANETARKFVASKVRDIVKDPKTAEILTPRTIIGCKRLCLDNDGYYETFNRPNVSLVDVSDNPIQEITPAGLKTGTDEYEFDAIVFATGFDAMTGSILKVDIRGKNGKSIQDKWAAGPRTYLGLTTAGFPNLFTVSGPGSPSVLSNMLPTIEQHVNWIADCVAYMEDHGHETIDATLEAEDDWVDHVNHVAGETLFLGCNSWYLGANVPGKPRVFMPYVGVPPYVEICNSVADDGYRGFTLS